MRQYLIILFVDGYYTSTSNTKNLPHNSEKVKCEYNLVVIMSLTSLTPSL